MSYHRQHWKKWANLVGEFVPAVDMAVDVYTVVDRANRPNMPYVRHGHPLITNVPWQYPGPPPHPMRVQDVLNRVGGLLSVPVDTPDAERRMDAVEALLRSVPPVELDQVVVRLGPQGLADLGHLLCGVEGDDSSWDFYRVQGFLNFLLEYVSPYGVGMLGAHLPACQPVMGELFHEDKDDGWLLPAGPFLVFDDKAYRADEGFRVEASIAPMAWQDMNQGRVGDCWFLTSAQAVCKANPNFLPHHIRQNPNGTVTVTFYREDDHQPSSVTVAPDLPVRDGILFGACGHTDDPAYAELWPAYYEKAFAQFRGGYPEIEGGWGEEAFNVITGRPIEKVDPRSPHLPFEIHDRLRRGYAVAVATVGRSDTETMLDGRLVERHMYFIKDVDPAAGRICLGNPWGDGAARKVWECWLTHAEAAEYLDEVATVWPW